MFSTISTIRNFLCGFCAVIPLLWGATALAQGIEDFELYILDTKSGEVTRVSDTPDHGLFSPAFSHNGKVVIHVSVHKDTGEVHLARTTVKTGETVIHDITGNAPNWSPNGKYIAYDTFVTGVDYPDWNIYMMPADGGDPVLVRELAADANWGNNDQRIAFGDVNWIGSYPNWGYYGTIKPDGTDEVRLDTVGAAGCAFDYAPNGKSIVYTHGDPVTFGGCFGGWPAPLMLVPLDQHGNPLGDPYPLTDGLYYDGVPTISNNGKYVVFHSHRSETGAAPWEFDLWMVSTDGNGDVQKLYGLDNVEEYDPSYSKNGRYVVFSSNRDAVLRAIDPPRDGKN